MNSISFSSSRVCYAQRVSGEPLHSDSTNSNEFRARIFPPRPAPRSLAGIKLLDSIRLSHSTRNYANLSVHPIRRAVGSDGDAERVFRNECKYFALDVSRVLIKRADKKAKINATTFARRKRSAKVTFRSSSDSLASREHNFSIW